MSGRREPQAIGASRLMRAALSATLAMAMIFSPHVWALGPFEKNDPLVQQGIDSYNAGKYEDALKAFDSAQKQMPQSAAVEFNRGNALFKLKRTDEAKEAYRHVEKMDQGDLAERDHYNLGNAWAEIGDSKQAISEFRRALTMDPSDDMARHNLEVVLRNLPPPKKDQPDGGSDGGQPDAGQDGGHPDGGGRPDAGQPDGGRDGGSDGGEDGGADGGPGDGGMDGGSDGGQGQGGGNKKGDAGTPQPQPDEAGSDGGSNDSFDAGEEEPEEVAVDAGTQSNLSKKDTERLLDSMRQTEKNLQLWRFQVKKKPRKPNEKDW